MGSLTVAASDHDARRPEGTRQLGGVPAAQINKPMLGGQPHKPQIARLTGLILNADVWRSLTSGPGAGGADIR